MHLASIHVSDNAFPQLSDQYVIVPLNGLKSQTCTREEMCNVTQVS